ncbi:MAG: glycosyltransferase family 4 protein [Bacteroidetes bacterium]|nr:glycosyltransferase family 4 protein [Bacteroidota bacterium]
MKRILFIAAHRPDRSPSQRFRFEQYIEFLEKNGYHCKESCIINERDEKHFYNPGSFPFKAYIFLRSFAKRLFEFIRYYNYDIIFVHREAFMTGTTIFERLYKRTKAKLIFDFDDSIWIHNVSDANKKLSWLKSPEKTGKIIEMADLIFAGNQYLADYAKKYNSAVVIIPTTIDTNEYKNLNLNNHQAVCIGWSGSMTTIKHFEYAIPFLIEIKRKYGNRVYFKVIGDSGYKNEELGIKGIGWKKEEEIKELSTFDIGIMPLPHDEWAKGKCGLKGLQYMALEIPTIMSPVGVNVEIIKDGTNGFLAETTEDWINKLSSLIESEELRKQIGKSGRKTVEENYSVTSQEKNYLKYFNEIIENGKSRKS